LYSWNTAGTPFLNPEFYFPIIFFLEVFTRIFSPPYFPWKKGASLLSLKRRRKAVENEIQPPVQSPAQPATPSAETPPQSPEQPVSAEAAVPQQEPIVLGKLFPDAKNDLDALFPDPQMKELLKEVHKNRQGNQRFIKRLNLSKIEEDDESPSDP
jgi:hypothetical protein